MFILYGILIGLTIVFGLVAYREIKKEIHFTESNVNASIDVVEHRLTTNMARHFNTYEHKPRKVHRRVKFRTDLHKGRG